MNKLGSTRGGGQSPEKVVWVCLAVKAPFSRLSRRSLGPHLQHDSVLKTPHLEQKYQILTPTREICQKFEEFSALQPKLVLAQISVHKPSKC